MHDLNLNSIYYSKMLCHALGEVHGAVLTSGAAEGDLKMVAAIALVLLDRLADKRLGRFKEWLDCLPVLQGTRSIASYSIVPIIQPGHD